MSVWNRCCIFVMLKRLHGRDFNRPSWIDMRRMKRVISILLSLVVVATVAARPLSEREACVLATKFYYAKKLGNKIQKVKSLQALNLIYSPLHADAERYAPPEYYVFAPENKQGFVIVSGDDRTQRPIVAYSLDSEFKTNPSQSFKDYLTAYTRYVDSLRVGRAEVKEPRKATPVEPLVQMQWNQKIPYNTYCPELNGRLLQTGCTATALTQVMHYHAWPKQGVGRCRAYVINTDTIISEVELGETYDWEKMRSSYSTSSKAKKDADGVARLMRDVGHAIQMKYLPAVSSAIDVNVVAALLNNFDYSPQLRHLFRDFFTDNEWHRIVSAELAAGRPIYYSARPQWTSSGHAFVCSGMDEQGLLYINWGWGGEFNGYFDLEVVADWRRTFNYMQHAIVGIRPRAEGERVEDYSTIPHVGRIEVIEQDTTQLIPTAYITVHAQNASHVPVEGKLGMAVYDAQGNRLSDIRPLCTYSLAPDYYQWYNRVRINPDVLASNAEYTICFFWQPKGKKSWQPPVGNLHTIRLSMGSASGRFTGPISLDE